MKLRTEENICELVTDEAEILCSLVVEENDEKSDRATAITIARRLYTFVSASGSKGMLANVLIGDTLWCLRAHNGVIDSPHVIEDTTRFEEEVLTADYLPKVSLIGQITDLNVKAMPLAELDYIALHRNGVIGVISPDDDMIREDLTNWNNSDWEVQWIATHDRIDKGILVLKPKSKRTKQLSVIGKAIYLSKEYKWDPEFSQDVVTASWAIKGFFRNEILSLLDLVVKHENWWCTYFDGKGTVEVRERFMKRYPTKDWGKLTQEDWNILGKFLDQYIDLDINPDRYPIFPAGLMARLA